MLNDSTFSPSWSSLSGYETPDWFRDAKFGIFIHWGVMTVPELSCWYARQMYMERGSYDGGAVYRQHLQRYGHPSQFGFKDLIPLWTADRFDPDDLVELFRQSGARYVVPVAAHHDNFDNFDSSFQPWNSVNMGPRRDIIGEWKLAIESRGLRFGVSSHSDRAWQWLHPSHGRDVTGPYADVPYDGNLTILDGAGMWWEGLDPQDLYGRRHDGDPQEPDESYMQRGEPPDLRYRNNWLARTTELVHKYEPDLLYFDGPLPFGERGLRLAADFYNRNRRRHGGRLEAVLNIKSWGLGTVPDESAIVLDIEKGLSDVRRQFAWQTDTSILSDWVYTPGPHALSDTVIIHNLCDIVSKNGNLLLNVSPRADGTLPRDQRETLGAIGSWLAANGEAIYGTRPWRVFGEGPTEIEQGDFKENTKPLTTRDIRFTSRKPADTSDRETVYAIVMGRPPDGIVRISSIRWASAVTLLESETPVAWEASTGGLTVQLPPGSPEPHALALRLQGAE